MTALPTMLVALLLGASAAGAEPPVLLGKPPPRAAAPLNLAALRDRPLLPLRLVIDTPYEIGSGLVTYVHVTAYTPDFQPAAGARIYADGVPAGITDDGGTLVFRHTPRPAPRDAQAGDAGDVFAADVSGRVTLTGVWEGKGARHVGQVGFESYRRTASFERAQLFVYTDRGVYQPGDVVHVRAVAWRLLGDYEPITAEKVELHLTNGEGRLVGGGAFTTNRWGTGSFDLPLPDAMPEASYELAAVFGGARGEARLRVERYVPPAVQIEHDLQRYLATGAERLSFVVRVSALGGAPLRGGELAVRVEHQGETFFTTSRRLDGAASVEIDVDPPALRRLIERAGDGATFAVHLTATDDSGRSDTVRRDVLLSRDPYTCILEADKDSYVAGETAHLQVKLRDLDEAPVRGRKIRLSPSHGAAPPPAATDASGIALFSLPMTGENLLLRAYLDGVAEPLGELELASGGAKAMSSAVAVPLVSTGQKVPIEVHIAPEYEPVEKRVHADVVDSSGALVSAFTLPIGRGPGGWVARGNFVAPSWGTMLLTMYCAARFGEGPSAAGNVGLLTEGQQITVTRTGGLVVTLAGIPQAAKPGQKLKLVAQVTDKAGKPRAAVVGASVSDAGVLALLDPLEVLPEDRFYNPELKVLAETGAKILTWPVVSRNWGDQRLDIALPPFDFQPGGADDTDLADLFGADPVEGELSGTAGVGSLGIGAGGGGMGMGYGSAAGAGPGGLRSLAAPAVSTPLTVTVRTRFADTSLWLPDGETRGGRLELEVELPDALTRQTVTLVASDERGGIATLRRDIPVRQALSARSDFPPVLRLGETVDVAAAVQSLASEPLRATLELRAVGLALSSAAAIDLQVPAQGAAAAAFRVTPQTLGAVTYELRARAGSNDDTEKRTVQVLPAGAAVSDTSTGTAARGLPFTTEVQLEPGSTLLAHVLLPGGGRVVREYLALLARGVDASPGFWEVPGTQAALAYRVAMFLDAQGALTPTAALRLRDAIAEDLLRIGLYSDGSGGVAFLRTGSTSPYLTGRALEGLSAARATNFPVPPERLQAAARVILSAVDARGQVSIDDIAWWEGESTDRRLALTAQLFRVIAEAGPDAVPEDQRATFERLRAQAERIPSLTDDPLAIANAGLGLLAYAADHAHNPLDAKVARRLLRRIMESYRGGGWAPSWFNATGGRLEASAAALELTHHLDPETAAPLIREVTDGLLAARDSLGSWHDTAGSIALVRALAALPVEPGEAQGYKVRIEVDGMKAGETPIDPRDPFVGALGLATVDLTPHLGGAAPHHLTVSTSGLLPVRVTLERRRYAATTAAGSLDLRRQVTPAAARAGDEVTVTLTLQSKAPLRQVALEEPLPSNAEVVREALEAQVSQGVLSAYHVDGARLVLYLGNLGADATLTYRLRLIRSGVGTLGPTLVRTIGRPESAALVGVATTVRGSD